MKSVASYIQNHPNQALMTGIGTLVVGAGVAISVCGESQTQTHLQAPPVAETDSLQYVGIQSPDSSLNPSLKTESDSSLPAEPSICVEGQSQVHISSYHKPNQPDFDLCINTSKAQAYVQWVSQLNHRMASKDLAVATRAICEEVYLQSMVKSAMVDAVKLRSVDAIALDPEFMTAADMQGFWDACDLEVVLMQLYGPHLESSGVSIRAIREISARLTSSIYRKDVDAEKISLAKMERAADYVFGKKYGLNTEGMIKDLGYDEIDQDDKARVVYQMFASFSPKGPAIFDLTTRDERIQKAYEYRVHSMHQVVGRILLFASHWDEISEELEK